MPATLTLVSLANNLVMRSTDDSWPLALLTPLVNVLFVGASGDALLELVIIAMALRA